MDPSDRYKTQKIMKHENLLGTNSFHREVKMQTRSSQSQAEAKRRDFHETNQTLIWVHLNYVKIVELKTRRINQLNQTKES